MEKVLFFGGRWGCFSNMAAFRVYWRGADWMTSEHAFMATKFDDPRIADAIRCARSGYEAKKLAQTHAKHIVADWDEKKLAIMEEIVHAKLSQHPYIQKKLLETGDRDIVEDSPTDSFWGRGPDWRGENHLGKIWMKLREEMRSRMKR